MLRHSKREMILACTLRRLLAAILCALALAACVTRNDLSENRVVQPLNDGWRFAKDLPDDSAYFALGFDDSSWDLVTLPHTPRIEPLIVNDQWQGDAWYRRTLTIPAEYRGRKVFVRFGAAMQFADVWLNGEFVGNHLGGYLPFGFDLTEIVRFGEPNLLAVGLNNEDNPLIPPGKALRVLDFNYFGGLYRKVELILTEDLYITDANLVDVAGGGGVYAFSSDVSPGAALLHVNVHVQNDALVSQQGSVRIELRSPDGAVALAVTSDAVDMPSGTDHTFHFSHWLEDPLLWSPNRPHLYDLTAEVLRSGAPVDSKTIRIGIREFRLTDEGFFINGEPVFLRGTNRHQEYPYVGYAVPDAAQRRDAVKIKSAGFDIVRLSHYPHSEAFLRAADEIGLVLMDCIPGWQFFGNDEFQQNSISDVRAMARRDRNHASVAFWEVSLNESGMDDAFMAKANDALREELPGQSVITAGWIDRDSYDLFIPARQHARPPDYWNNYKDGLRPLFIAEYGDWEYFAQNAGFNQDEFSDLEEEERTSRQLRGAGEEKLLQQALNYQEAANSNRKGQSTIGHANWLMFDYNRGYADDLESSGISDLFRLPKFSYYFYQSQRPPEPKLDPALESGPMVFVASYWQPSSTTRVHVFSNTEEVELYLNGVLVDRRAPDENVNTTHLLHPPFTFRLERFEPGTLRAVGYIDEREVASYEVATPEKASRLALEVDLSGVGVSSERDDLLFVYARVVDERGRPIPNDSSVVRFTVDGAAWLVGPSSVKAEAGIATALVRTSASTSPITIFAASNDLESDSLRIER